MTRLWSRFIALWHLNVCTEKSVYYHVNVCSLYAKFARFRVFCFLRRQLLVHLPYIFLLFYVLFIYLMINCLLDLFLWILLKNNYLLSRRFRQVFVCFDCDWSRKQKVSRKVSDNCVNVVDRQFSCFILIEVERQILYVSLVYIKLIQMFLFWLT